MLGFGLGLGYSLASCLEYRVTDRVGVMNAVKCIY